MTPKVSVLPLAVSGNSEVRGSPRYRAPQTLTVSRVRSDPVAAVSPLQGGVDVHSRVAASPSSEGGLGRGREVVAWHASDVTL